MSGERPRAISTPGDRGDPARRGPGTILASVLAHVVGIAILVRIAIVPITWNLTPRATPHAEQAHVDYIRIASDSSAKRRSGGDNRRITNHTVPAQIVAPSAIPSALPPEPAKAAPAPAPQSDAGSGPVIGAGGPTRGVTPEFLDSRLWAPTAPAAVAPKSKTELLDSAIATRVHHLEDSLAALGPQRAPGDWTMKGKDGKKYGIDQKYIHLGNFSIPTALLALLPLNVQGNPSTYENAKRIGAMRAEILDQDARAARDEDFSAAVKELRQRMQRERAEKAKEDETLPLAPPPPRIVPQ